MAKDHIELENRVRKILLDSPYAILATVGDNAEPYARWMSPIFATGSLERFHTLAAPASRKIAHIRANEKVSWVFHTPQFDEVVTVHGRASVDDDPLLRAEIWESMPDKQRSFILRNDENLEFVIIRTEVETLEYLRPKEGQTTPVVISPRQ